MVAPVNLPKSAPTAGARRTVASVSGRSGLGSWMTPTAVKKAVQGELHRRGRSVVGVVTDSRQETAGQLFVALTGPNHDGHDHVVAAIERGARGVLIERSVDAVPGLDRATGAFIVQVDNCREALLRLAAVLNIWLWAFCIFMTIWSSLFLGTWKTPELEELEPMQQGAPPPYAPSPAAEQPPAGEEGGSASGSSSSEDEEEAELPLTVFSPAQLAACPPTQPPACLPAQPPACPPAQPPACSAACWPARSAARLSASRAYLGRI